MSRLYCATGNAGKLSEFRLAAVRTGLEIEGVPDFKTIPPCFEDGATFSENAIKKARHYAAYVKDPVFADDSGLVVEALDGAPGVYSARYAGPAATDEANNRLLLEKLRGITNRAASFVCLIALVEGGRQRGIFAGRVDGVILDEPRGSSGFGYDPLFYCPPLGCTFGEASEEQKFEVSHRGQAFRSMLARLR
ncbi:MAG: RdgB/HAM1 family non-canonical purine NTP pyrophosphatase [Candidatus Sulfopaludibacter sp.]|nr:RdgB/HAM1 family non-canonical purine NTP pyrophosphatase [Candidatus Sulfopaludibacter sp.]